MDDRDRRELERICGTVLQLISMRKNYTCYYTVQYTHCRSIHFCFVQFFYCKIYPHTHTVHVNIWGVLKRLKIATADHPGQPCSFSSSSSYFLLLLSPPLCLASPGCQTQRVKGRWRLKLALAVLPHSPLGPCPLHLLLQEEQQSCLLERGIRWCVYVQDIPWLLVNRIMQTVETMSMKV